MSKLLKVQMNAGLNVAQGHYARPDGAVRTARNMVIDSPGVIRSRQGFLRHDAITGCIYKGISTPELGSLYLANVGQAGGATTLVAGDGTAAWSTVSMDFDNTDNRMQCAVARGNHYLTSDAGLRRYESSGTLYYAGMPPGLALMQLPNVLVASTSGFLADNEQVAYRVTFVRDDADGLPMEGAPSSRTVVIKNTNTSGNIPATTQAVVCVIPLPDQVGQNGVALTTAYSVRLWRSAISTVGGPPDDMRLVWEHKLTSTDISNGYATFTDTTPEGFRILSPPLYTNANDGGENGVGGPGIQQANAPPPRPRAVETFADCLFIGNLLGYHTLDLTLLSTVAGTGLTAGDTLQIAGVTYTAIAGGPAVSPAADRFMVYAAGAITPSEALERTAQDICRCVNDTANTNSPVYAVYVPGANELPGKIRFIAKTIGYGPFQAFVSAHSAAWRPELVLAVGATSKAEEQPNALMFSKPSQPDSIPAVNQIFVGRRGNQILAMRRLRNVLYVFCTQGVWRVVGNDPLSFSLEEVTDTISILGSELICSCDDAIYGMSANGVWRFTEGGGPELVSNPIEPLLWQAVNNTSPFIAGSYGWATAYRTRHKVVFALPTLTDNQGCNNILVMDTRLGAWTQWDFPEELDACVGRSCGFVSSVDDTLRMGSWTELGADYGSLYYEQLTYTAADYTDQTVSDTVPIPRTVTLSVATIAPDDLQTFDEVHVMWESSDVFTSLTSPAGVATVTFTADGGNPSGAATLVSSPGGNASSRQLVPQSQRTSSRLLVQIDAPSATAQYFAIEGIALEVVDSGSNRTRRQ